MTLEQVTIATKYYSNLTYEVAPTYNQVTIDNNAFGGNYRVYRINLPINAYLKMDYSNYKVISNYQEDGANTWYISSSSNNISVQILTPECYNLGRVGKFIK